MSTSGSIDTSSSGASTVLGEHARDKLSEALENLSIRSRTYGARANRKKVPIQFKKVRGIFALLQGLLDAPLEIFLFEVRINS